MNLTQAVTRIASLTNKLASDSKVITRIKSHINEVCRREWSSFPWSFKTREYTIKTTASITSGTVSVTSGSRTVTFSSAILDTTEHKNWYLTITGVDPVNVYKLANILSTTQATLDQPYSGTTNASATYSLDKMDYELPPEVESIKSIKIWSGSNLVSMSDAVTFVSDNSLPSGGYPIIGLVAESNPIPTTYLTGTLSGTVSTNTLTGSGTSWLSNVKPGDVITISETDYTVYEVLTDTSIVLYNKLKQTYSAGTTYTATRLFPIKLKLNPADRVYTIAIFGYRKYNDLVNDTDSNELLNRFNSAVIQSCVELEEIASPDSRADSQNSRASVLWNEAKSTDRNFTQRVSKKTIFSSRRYNR